LPKFHISDHKEVLKSISVDVLLVFSLMWYITMMNEGVALQVTLKDFEA